MTLFTRIVKFPVAVTAADAQGADQFVRDQVEAVVEALDVRDTTRTFGIGRVSVTRPGDQPEPAPAPAKADYVAAFGSGPLARAKVGEWLSKGRAVDSRLVRGGWVHRPVQAPAPETRAAA